MYIKRNISWKIIVRFGWKLVLFYLMYSTIIVMVHMYFHARGTNLSIPFAPVSTIGVAVAFYLGFKNNQSYDRFWEARTIWGGIVNLSRTWGNQVLTYLNDNVGKEEYINYKKVIIYRQIAWINSLRLSLRRPTTFSNESYGSANKYQFGRPSSENWDSEVRPFLSPKEYNNLSSAVNFPTQVICNQGKELRHLYENKMIEEFRLIDMMNTLKDLLAEQGRAERIKNTPFPRQYAYFSKIFTWIFILLLPLALVWEFEKLGEEFIWLVIPFTTIISWIFMTMELVGDNSEDPFENFINDVPMTALCRNIEIDLRQMLGEENLPERIQAKDGILM